MSKYRDFTLSWTANKGKAIITAEHDGDAIHVDTIDPTSAAARTKYATALAAKHCDPEQVEDDLLVIATEFGSSVAGNPTKQTGSIAVEVDLSDIHRPERILLPGISGLTVPLFLDGNDRIIPLWRCYIVADGQRTTMDVKPRMKIDDKRIFVQPVPSDPDSNCRTCWSLQSREQWLNEANQVDPAELFQRLVTAIDYHVEFEAEQRKGILATVACWVVLTYSYHVWPAVPYLFLNGPAGSGKSTTFDVLQKLCFRVFKTDMPSPSTIFRTLHETGGTLLYDEAERLKQTKSEDIGKINAMLLAGYRRGGSADLMEKVGDNFKRVSFQVYGPKAIANINGVPPALASRSIEITMQKADPDSQKPNRQIGTYDWQPIIDALHILAIDNGNAWLDMASQNNRGAGLNGRDNELWKPLVAIGQWFESHGVDGLTDTLVEHANTSAADSRELATSDIDNTLLTILASKLRRGALPTNKEILDAARDEDSITFKSWSDRGIGSRLRAFGLRTSKSNGRRVYRDIDKLRDIERRHGLDFGFGEVA